jgi:hypothetical protein
VSALWLALPLKRFPDPRFVNQPDGAKILNHVVLPCRGQLDVGRTAPFV